MNDDDLQMKVGCGCFAVVVGVVGIVFACSVMGGCNDSYSEGVRTGKLIKASHKGVIWKSYECQLQLSEFGLTTKGGDDNNAGNLWEFSCRDESLGKSLEESVGKRVSIHYKQWLLKPAQQSTDYTAVRIDEAKP